MKDSDRIIGKTISEVEEIGVTHTIQFTDGSSVTLRVYNDCDIDFEYSENDSIKEDKITESAIKLLKERGYIPTNFNKETHILNPSTKQ